MDDDVMDEEEDALILAELAMENEDLDYNARDLAKFKKCKTKCEKYYWGASLKRLKDRCIT